MFDFAIKELLRRKKLYLLAVLTMGLVTALIIILNSLSIAYRDAARLPFNDVQGTIVIQRNGNVPADVTGVLLSCSLAPIDPGVASKISQYDGVKGVSSALSLWVFDADNFKRVLGVNWTDKSGTGLKIKVISGAVPSSDQEVLLEKTYADQHGLAVGQDVNMGGRSFRVSGILRTAGNEIVAADAYVNLTMAQAMAYASANLQKVEAFGAQDVNIIFVDAAQPSITAVTGRIKADTTAASSGGQTPLGNTVGNFNIYTPQSFEGQISSLFKMSDRLTWLISIIIFIAAAIVIARSVLYAVMERRKEFGIMKSVGFRNRDVQKGILISTALQAGIGFLLGLSIAVIAIGLFSRTTVSIAIPWELTAYPHFLLPNPEAANVTQVYRLPINLEPVYVLGAFLTVAVMATISAVIGTTAINRLKPMQVMKYE